MDLLAAEEREHSLFVIGERVHEAEGVYGHVDVGHGRADPLHLRSGQQRHEQQQADVTDDVDERAHYQPVHRLPDGPVRHRVGRDVVEAEAVTQYGLDYLDHGDDLEDEYEGIADETDHVVVPVLAQVVLRLAVDGIEDEEVDEDEDEVGERDEDDEGGRVEGSVGPDQRGVVAGEHFVPMGEKQVGEAAVEDEVEVHGQHEGDAPAPTQPGPAGLVAERENRQDAAAQRR